MKRVTAVTMRTDNAVGLVRELVVEHPASGVHPDHGSTTATSARTHAFLYVVWVKPCDAKLLSDMLSLGRLFDGAQWVWGAWRALERVMPMTNDRIHVIEAILGRGFEPHELNELKPMGPSEELNIPGRIRQRYGAVLCLIEGNRLRSAALMREQKSPHKQSDKSQEDEPPEPSTHQCSQEPPAFRRLCLHREPDYVCGYGCQERRRARSGEYPQRLAARRGIGGCQRDDLLRDSGRGFRTILRVSTYGIATRN